MESATRSLGELPAPFKYSHLANISHPVASDKDFNLMSGVPPADHPVAARSRTIYGGYGLPSGRNLLGQVMGVLPNFGHVFGEGVSEKTVPSPDRDL